MRRAWYVPLLLAVLFVAPSPTAAQEQAAAPRLENLLPDNTFFYASLNDVSSMKNQFARTALSKLWNEPEVQRFLEPALQFLNHQIESAERRIGHPIRGLLDSLQGQAALGVVEFDPRYAGAVPDAVLTVDLGEGAAAFRKVHADALANAGDRIRVETKEHAGLPYEIVTTPVGLQLSIGYFGTSLVVTTQAARFEALVDAWKNGLATSLAKSPSFQAVAQHVGGRSTFLNAYVNVEGILAHFGDMIDPQTAHILDAAGIAGIRAVGMGSSFVSEGIRDSFFVYSPGEKKGIMKLAFTAPGKGTGLLDHVPATAFYASAGAANWDKMMEIVLDTIGDVEPMILDQVMGGIYQAEEFLGLRIREDLLQPMGDEMAFYASMPDGGGLIPDFVMLCRMDDPARFEESLSKVLSRLRALLENNRRLSMEHRTMEFHGRTIHYVHVAHQWGDPFPLTPSFVFDGNVCAVALFPQPLKDLIVRGNDVPKIKDRPDYARVLKGLPEGMQSLEYVDFNAGARMLYGTLATVAQAAAKKQEIPVDFAYLPRTETVAKHLFGGIWGGKPVDAGLEIHAYTPCGIGPVVVGIMAPMMWLGMSTVRRVEMAEATRGRAQPQPADRPRQETRDVPARPEGSAKAKLEQIYIALLYHYAERDSYPADLGALVTTKALENADALVLPGDAGATATAGGVKTSFAYAGPKVGDIIEGSGHAVWVYAQDRIGGGSRWVLFADGTVRQVPQAEFAKLLAGTKEMLGGK